MTASTMLTNTRSRSSRAAVSNDLAADHRLTDALGSCVGGTPLAGDHATCGAQSRSVSGIPLAGDHAWLDAPKEAVSGIPLAPGQTGSETQPTHAGGDTLPPTILRAEPITAPSAASPSGPAHHNSDAQNRGDGAGTIHEGLLGLAAETLSDIERIRIAGENRLRAMRDDHGVADTPEYQRAEAVHAALAAVEHQATLDLGRQMRKHPLGPWVAATVGIGPKQGARLIAAIGDPYWNTLEDRPRRGPAELWAFCGYKPGQKRQKGVRSNWNPEAKMRAHLCAESCIKQMHSPYRKVYDAARLSWADRDVSDGHKHNHALRCVAKRILRDLYLAAKEAA